MIAALRSVWRGITRFEDHSWLFVSANIVAVLLSIPIITAPAAFAGLCSLGHVALTGPTAEFNDFWVGFRAHFRHGILIGIANVVVFIILWANFSAYRYQADLLFVLLRGVWLAILFFWFGLQFYLWPMLEEMKQPTLLGGLRNAWIMTVQNPGFTVTLFVVVLIIVVLSTMVILPWLLLSASMIACIANAAVINRLEIIRAAQQSTK